MNNSNQADTPVTQNSLTATVNGESFVATVGFKCIKDEFGWTFAGTHPSPLSFIDFHIKSIKSGRNEFDLTLYDHHGDATGFYFAGSSQVQSNSGRLEINYFEAVNRMEGSFHFIAKSGNLEYDIKDGKYALTVQQEPLANGLAAAKISGSLNLDFEAKTVDIRSLDNGRIWIGADYRLNPSEWYRMVLNIPDTLQPDIEHPFDDKKIMAFFYDMSGGFYQPKTGMIKLLCKPTKEHFEADFQFESEFLIPSNKQIQLREGKFRFPAAKTPAANSSKS